MIIKEPFVNTDRLISYYHPEGEEFSASEVRQNLNKSLYREQQRKRREQQLRKAIEDERERNAKTEKRLRERGAKLSQVRKNYKEVVVRKRNCLARSYNAIQQSRTWRYTRFVRKISGALKGFISR